MEEITWNLWLVSGEKKSDITQGWEIIITMSHLLRLNLRLHDSVQKIRTSIWSGVTSGRSSPVSHKKQATLLLCASISDSGFQAKCLLLVSPSRIPVTWVSVSVSPSRQGGSFRSTSPSRTNAHRPPTSTVLKTWAYSAVPIYSPEKTLVIIYDQSRFRVQSKTLEDRVLLNALLKKLLFSHHHISWLTELLTSLPQSKFSFILWPFRASCPDKTWENECKHVGYCLWSIFLFMSFPLEVVISSWSSSFSLAYKHSDVFHENIVHLFFLVIGYPFSLRCLCLYRNNYFRSV